MKFFLNKSGFTFVEVLITLGIIGFLIGLAIPFYQTFYISNQLDNTSTELIQTLRRAQLKAMASEEYQTFGVHLEQRKFVLFKGTSYNPNDSYNEFTELPNTLTLTANTGPEVFFNYLKGETTNTATIIITSSNNRSQTLSINEVGKINVL